MTLPSQFSDLNGFLEKWDQPDTNARYAVRLSSTMEELREFYGAMLPRVEEIKTHLDGKNFADYNDADKSLGRLMFAVGIVGPAVDIFHQQEVPDSGATSFFVVDEPHLN